MFTLSRRSPALLLALAGLVIAGCGDDDAGGSAASGADRIDVVATTTVLGDLVREVGGEAVDLTQILQPNSDAHDYEPRPDDVRDTAGAQVVVASGDNLDRWIGDVVEQSGSDAVTIDVSQQLKVRLPGESEGEEASKHDPHWWHDPRNTETAVEEIRDAFIKANPGARAVYERNAIAYIAKVKALDTGIAECFAAVPARERKLVTDHDAFGYFADRYDITVVGAVIPSQTTQAQPSAGEVAELVRTIEREDVKAVFPESSVNPKLAQAIAKQTGASAEYTLYGDSLGEEGSPGATYLGMEQANADAMVKGFTGGSGSCRVPGI